MAAAGSRRAGRSATLCLARAAAAAAFLAAPWAHAQDADAMLDRAGSAARALSYTGTIVYQRGTEVETSRIVHVNDGGDELEKLVNLDGPAREVIRRNGEVRCYYPDVKLVRIEPRTFRNAFPSISPQQKSSLAKYYVVRKGATGRIAGLEAQAWNFEPRDGLRYGYEFWTDPATGMLLRARTLNERGEVIEQFAFLDIALGVKLERDAAQPSWPPAPADWQVRQQKSGAAASVDTGWVVGRAPPGFVKIMEGQRGMRDQKRGVVQIVFSDGLVAVSVFIEPRGGAQRRFGRARQGGINQYSVKHDDHVITALGEVPAEAVRLMATSVTRQ